jgi:hypothetical protein
MKKYHLVRTAAVSIGVAGGLILGMSTPTS